MYKNTKQKNTGNRKFILYILIVILIVSVVTLAIRIGNDRKKKESGFLNLFNSVSCSAVKINCSSENGMNFTFAGRSGAIWSVNIRKSIEGLAAQEERNKPKYGGRAPK